MSGIDHERELAPKKPRTRQARWRAENPKAYWAHAALLSGIRRGIVSGQPCEFCGSEKVDGHHVNYNRPLVVRWLCRRHHSQVHKETRAEVVTEGRAS